MLLPIRTKEQAWVDAPNQRVVPIDLKRFPYRFRRNWFKLRNQCTFSSYMLDRFPADQPWKMLTIGVFEGAQEVWLLQHILQHPESKLFCIDPWQATTKLDQTFMDECYSNARHNLSEWYGKVNLQRGYSQEIMASAVQDGGYLGEPLGSFDQVIIDGDHVAEPVYRDAVNAFEFAKVGGWLMFDDVRNRIEKADHVKQGLEKFLPEYANRVEFAWAHRYCDCYTRTK